MKQKCNISSRNARNARVGDVPWPLCRHLLSQYVLMSSVNDSFASRTVKHKTF